MLRLASLSIPLASRAAANLPHCASDSPVNQSGAVVLQGAKVGSAVGKGRPLGLSASSRSLVGVRGLAIFVKCFDAREGNRSVRGHRSLVISQLEHRQQGHQTGAQQLYSKDGHYLSGSPVRRIQGAVACRTAHSWFLCCDRVGKEPVARPGCYRQLPACGRLR